MPAPSRSRRRALTTLSALPALVALTALASGLSACKEPPLPMPAPDGKDIVAGAVLAATESSGGIRLYKVVHVDDFPQPIGFEYHLIAFEPKAADWESVRPLWRQKKQKLTVFKDHVLVRKLNWLKRDYRVVTVEPVTPDDKVGYERDRTARQSLGL